jgi:hypothetical protein
MNAPHAATVEHGLEVPARRLLWCSAGGRVLHGRTRPAPAPSPGFLQKILGIRPHGGTIFEFESVELAAAQAALAAHFEAPGAFAIETAEGARLDFLASRFQDSVTIDCWFFEPDGCDLDAVALARPAAQALLTSLYELQRDVEIAARLRDLARSIQAA